MISSDIPKRRIYPIALAWLKLAPCGRFKALNRADHLVVSREGLTIFKESHFPPFGTTPPQLLFSIGKL